MVKSEGSQLSKQGMVLSLALAPPRRLHFACGLSISLE